MSPISIHAPSRERRAVSSHNPRCVLISIHAPSRERRLRQCWQTAVLYFNPRSLTGATDKTFDELVTKLISIHAPSRERLSNLDIDIATNDISIHAPSRERRLRQCWQTAVLYFNPRSLTGATDWLSPAGRKRMYFNPRSLTGAT